MRVLLVEDDPQLGDGIAAGLREEGYTIDWLMDGLSAKAALASAEYEIAILDIALPGLTGLELLRDLRARGSNLPVLFLTARDTVADRVAGLDHGADDYLVKPFDLTELCARLRALQRRHHGRSEPVLRHRNLSLMPSEHRVRWDERVIELPRREFAVLELLLEHRGKVVPRHVIENHLYSWDEDVGSNTVEVYIHNLRRRFGTNLVRTVRGVGYIIDQPGEPGRHRSSTAESKREGD